MNAVNKNKPKIYFNIDSIRKISHFENNFRDFGLDKTNLDQYKFNFNVGLRINSEEGSITYQIKVSFHIEIDSEKYDLFGIETAHKFIIKDFKKLFSKSDCDEFSIPDDLMTNVLSISISGTRSMLAALNSTPEYTKILVPPIDPKDVLEKIKRSK